MYTDIANRGLRRHRADALLEMVAPETACVRRYFTLLLLVDSLVTASGSNPDKRAVEGGCSALHATDLRIAVGMFGFPLSLAETFSYNVRNVITPLRYLGSNDSLQVGVDLHLAMVVAPSAQERTATSQFGVEAVLSPEQALLPAVWLRPCRYEIVDQEAADLFVARPAFKEEAANSSIASSNLIRQYMLYMRLRNLILAQEAAMHTQYTHVVVLRIDTILPEPLLWLLPPRQNGVVVPACASQYIVNDRFAYGDRDSIMNVYLTQYKRVGRTLNAELLLCCVMVQAKVPVWLQRIVVQRLRGTAQNANGDKMYHKDKNWHLPNPRTTQDPSCGRSLCPHATQQGRKCVYRNRNCHHALSDISLRVDKVREPHPTGMEGLSLDVSRHNA